MPVGVESVESTEGKIEYLLEQVHHVLHVFLMTFVVFCIADFVE